MKRHKARAHVAVARTTHHRKLKLAIAGVAAVIVAFCTIYEVHAFYHEIAIAVLAERLASLGSAA